MCFNCQELASEERLYKFEKSMEGITWNVVGISETKRKRERLIERNIKN
jgi:hypothetical protein